MQVIDMRDNAYQDMQMAQEIGKSIGQIANGMRKTAVQSKLTAIMANKDFTDEQRLGKLQEAGGLWYVTGNDVQQYLQQPEIKQRFMQQHLGRDIYQQDYQKQAQEQIGSLQKALQTKEMLSGPQYIDPKTGMQTKAAQVMTSQIDNYLNSMNLQGTPVSTVDTQPTVAGEKAVLGLQQDKLGLQQSEQKIEQQNYEISQRQAGEERLRLESQTLQAKLDEISGKATESGMLAGKDKMNAEMDLRKEYNANKTVQAYNTVRTYKNIVNEASKRISKGERLATDETIIVGLKKIIEPDSVVRESEYARTPESVGLLDGLRGRLAKLTDGGSGIPADKLQEITTLVTQIEQIHKEAYDTSIEPYKASAKEYGLNEKLIFSSFEDANKDKPSSIIERAEKSLVSPILSTGGGLIEVDLQDTEGIDSLPPGPYIDKATGKIIIKE